MKTDPRLLKQIAGAKIKFVSVLAANRVRRLNESTLILKDGEYLKKGHPVKWKAADGKEVQGTVDSHQSGRYIDAVKVTKSKSRFYKPGDYADDVHLRDTGIKYEFEFDA